MNCPVCNVALSMTERQGVEIDYCPQCRGVWLDRGELDKIIERAAGEPTQPRQDDHRDTKRHDYERERPDHDWEHHKPRKKKSILGELFDF